MSSRSARTAASALSAANVAVERQTSTEDEDEEEGGAVLRGVAKHWVSVNHVAIVVRDIGRSLHFYTDVVGMKQVIRPDFDRHGAWLTFGNVDLHLIKGRPAVHADDDLIVSHIALTVGNMDRLRRRLAELGVPSRKNVSVPNPEEKKSVDQAFVRDPDGYYIEFCNCENLERYLHGLEEASAQETWTLDKARSLAKASKILRVKADSSREAVVQRILRNSPSPMVARRRLGGGVGQADDDSGNGNLSSSDGESALLGAQVEQQLSLNDGDGSGDGNDDDDDVSDLPEVDRVKLANLLKRRKVYGDVTQTASPDELELLLRRCGNRVPDVIAHLKEEVHRVGFQKHVPPAFFERDGVFYQPPSVRIEVVDRVAQQER